MLLFFSILSAFNTSFMYINYIEKNYLKEVEEDNRKKVAKFLEKLIRYKVTSDILNIVLITMYLKIIIFNVGRFFNFSILFFAIIISLLILLQIFIKAISKIDVYKTLINTIDFIDVLMIVLFPFVLIVESIYMKINNIFSDGKNKEERDLTEEDIRNIINYADNTEVEKEEKEMIHSIFNFTDTTVKEIMTPRTSIIAYDGEDILDNVWDDIIEHEFSRIPLYNESIDNICGVMYTKDLLKCNDRNIKLKNLMKDIVYVPETVTLTYMLEFFRQKQQHMAIIIDEYGGTLGLITIEDLLEEIVGEIRDEYDIEEENFKSISKNVYELLGETLVEEINEKYDLDIEESEEYDTISGYIQYKLERVAIENDKVINDGYIIQVLKVDNKKIEKVKLIIKR
ncbi:transporter associated domain-containing protein [Streptobacillus notomytis]|uniref:transporter associated domain-containing protein n=1 Tax=Streptobacillus notomytis TaxID=1712031 RepID=UPI00214B1A11|nr:transporter associated domain-containing protein [Streptobacillus notomytis]